jgi:hypothetical protein
MEIIRVQKDAGVSRDAILRLSFAGIRYDVVRYLVTRTIETEEMERTKPVLCPFSGQI